MNRFDALLIPEGRLDFHSAVEHPTCQCCRIMAVTSRPEKPLARRRATMFVMLHPMRWWSPG
ncbi:MAG: hypothetical protein R3C69_07110 [Geminicoccaceae bacterium]